MAVVGCIARGRGTRFRPRKLLWPDLNEVVLSFVGETAYIVSSFKSFSFRVKKSLTLCLAEGRNQELEMDCLKSKYSLHLTKARDNMLMVMDNCPRSPIAR
jgi:hypothetical protein